MTLRLFHAELFKIWKRQMLLVMGALTLVIIGVLYLTLGIVLASEETDVGGASDLEQALAFENVVPFGYRIAVSQVVSILAIILVSATVGGEYSWRTVVTMNAWVGDRARLLLARFAALWVTTLAAILGGFLFAFVCGAILSASRGSDDSIELSVGLLGEALAGAGYVWFGMLGYVALTFAITVMTRSTAAGIGIVLAARLLEPIGVAVFDNLGGPLETVKDFGLSQNVGSIQAQTGFIDGLDDESGWPPVWRSFLLVGGLSAALVVVSIRLTLRRDIVE